MKLVARWLLVAAVVGIAIAATVAPARRLSVTTAVVTEGAITDRVVATGTLQPVTTVPVSAQVSGTIQTLHADYNSIVHAGELIATLDPAAFEATVHEADATLREAQAGEARAEADRDRAETAVEDTQKTVLRVDELAAKSLVSRADFDAARSAADEAKADLQSAQSQIANARAAVKEAEAGVARATVDLDRTRIVAPISGVVIAHNVSVGQTVAADFQAPVLFTIAADLTRMNVEADVDESDIGRIRDGAAATFTVAAYPDMTFRGSVTQIRLQPVFEQTATATPVGLSASGASSEIGTVTGYAAMIEVANPDEKLRPGMTATVTFEGTHRVGVVRIPNAAFTFVPSADVLKATEQSKADFSPGPDDPAERRVWQFDRDRFVPVDVRVGIADLEFTEMVDGTLHSGDRVAISAAFPSP